MNAEDAPIDETLARQVMGRRRGVVRLDGRRVGVIEETNAGSRFTYDADWLALPDAISVSLTLPLRPEPHQSRGLLPFFENLLPEGWLLELSTAKLKIPKDDAFGLLLATCADCVGAVEVLADQDRQAGSR
jgi:serine/threonine-protein kinase HipA